MIHIKQTSPYVNASLAVMDNNRGTQTQNMETMVEYQIAYYDFPGETLLNVGTGQFNFLFSVIYAIHPEDVSTDPTLEDVYHAPQHPWTHFPIGKLPAYCMSIPMQLPQRLNKTSPYNAAEIAAAIDNQIRSTIMTKIVAASTKSQHTAEDLAFLLEFANFNKWYSGFYFDTATQKYMIQFTPPADLATYTYTSSDLINNVWTQQQKYYVADIEVAFEIPTTNLQTAKNLAALLGVDTKTQYLSSIHNNSGQTVFRSLLTTPQSIDRAATVYPPCPPLLMYVQTRVANLKAHFNSTYAKQIDFPNSTKGVQRYTLYGELVPKLAYDDFLYILTNSGCPSWRIDFGIREKSNILAVLPRSNGFGALPRLKDMYFHTSLYAQPSTLNSVRTLNLVIADEEGHPVHFQEPFRIGIHVRPISQMSSAVDIAKEIKGQ